MSASPVSSPPIPGTTPTKKEKKKKKRELEEPEVGLPEGEAVVRIYSFIKLKKIGEARNFQSGLCVILVSKDFVIYIISNRILTSILVICIEKLPLRCPSTLWYWSVFKKTCILKGHF
jgi:hypothetical protein